MQITDNKGIALIVVIIIIVIAAIAVLGIASAISNSVMLTATRVSMQKAVSAAEGGIDEIINKYKQITPWTPPDEYVEKIVDAESGSSSGVVYSAFTDPDFLLVKASDPVIVSSGSNYQLKNITLSNISRYSLTVSKMKIAWSGMSNSGTGFKFDSYVSGGTFSNGGEVAVSRSLTAGQSNAIFELYFSNDIPATATIIVTFCCPDSTWSRKAVLLIDGYAGNNEFQITSTGKIKVNDAVRYKRTIRATYDVGTSKITSWQETDAHL